MVRHIVLLGLMGAGKTTVGRGLADKLGWALRDSDPDIAATTGRSARQLDEERGTAELHRLEARQLVGAIGAPGPSVICAAASTIDDAVARAALAGADLLLVWLRADPATLARRVRGAVHRRDLGPDPVAAFAAQAATRYARWESLDPAIVEVDNRTPDEVIATVIARLEAGVP